MKSNLIRYGLTAAALTISSAAFAQSNQPPSTDAPGNQPGKMEMQESQSSMPMHHRHHRRNHHHHMGMSHGMSTSPAAGGSGQGDAAPNK